MAKPRFASHILPAFWQTAEIDISGKRSIFRQPDSPPSRLIRALGISTNDASIARKDSHGVEIVGGIAPATITPGFLPRNLYFSQRANETAETAKGKQRGNNLFSASRANHPRNEGQCRAALIALCSSRTISKEFHKKKYFFSFFFLCRNVYAAGGVRSRIGLNVVMERRVDKWKSM